MSLVHRPRRDRRARAGKRVRRRRFDKFIPDSDSDFALTSLQFARVIEDDPARFLLTAEDSKAICAAVQAFRAALSKSLHRFTRTHQAVMAKDTARSALEDIIRAHGDAIRASRRISELDKAKVRVKPQPRRKKKRTCPNRAPMLIYKGPIDTGGPGSHRHVLRYFDTDMYGVMKREKPEGATRIELFVDLVPQSAGRVPKQPGELTGRPWYLRSFTNSTMEVQFPMPSEPMLVVYWARWADAKGNVGPFSRTCVARVEGWSSAGAQLPEGEAESSHRVETKIVFIQTPYELTHQPRELIDEEPALLEAQMKMLDAA